MIILSNAVQSYIDEDGRKILYGYADEISAQPNEVIDEWREGKKRREYIANGPVLNYVNCYHEPVAALNDVLDVNELGAIMKLIPYIKMNTGGQLFYEGERMTVNLIAKALGISVNQTRRITDKLLEEGVISRERAGKPFVFSVDEQYHTIGHVVKGAQYTKVLQVKTRTDIRSITIRAAGVLYKMLPFFNYEHFYLCSNPNEFDEEMIYPLSHGEFADMVGVGRNVIDRGIRELTRHGFMLKVESYNGEIYVINPDIASRRKNMYDENSEKVRGFFRMAKRQGDRINVAIRKEELPY